MLYNPFKTDASGRALITEFALPNKKLLRITSLHPVSIVSFLRLCCSIRKTPTKPQQGNKSMASSPKQRPKLQHRNPNLSPPSHRIPLEPSANLFPTKSEFLKLLAVVTIASSVALACNFLVNVVNRQPKPFCDSNVEFDDSLSGKFILFVYLVDSISFINIEILCSLVF